MEGAFGELWRRRKRSQSLLAGDGNVSGIDAATGVNVGAAIYGDDRLKRLLPNERNIAGVNAATAVYIAEEDTKCCRNIALVCVVIDDAIERCGGILCVRHSGHLHHAFGRIEAGLNRAIGGGSAGYDRVREGKHNREIAVGAAGAAFHSSCSRLR